MSTIDVLIVGAGPAGAVAATLLARAGASVRLVDRATFPRDKLCGDTVNPGTLAMLRRLMMARAIDRRGLRIDGMRLTSASGVSIEGRYPAGCFGRALVRRDLDWLLLQDALAAGVHFEPNVTVRRALVDGTEVGGVWTRGRTGECPLRARVTLAADGRRSAIAFGLGLASHPRHPRRWAVGAYFADVPYADGAASIGEMHVRADRYIGVAAIPGGLTNVCVVKPARDPAFRDPAALLLREVSRDWALRDRFAAAHLVRPPIVLGPLAVDVAPRSIDGLLLAGDAAGFIDPITGDGLRFAIRGGEMAAAAALEALAHGWTGVHDRLALERRREFGTKWRFNRALRRLMSSPAAIGAVAQGARVAPALVRTLVRHAGDCAIAQMPQADARDEDDLDAGGGPVSRAANQ